MASENTFNDRTLACLDDLHEVVPLVKVVSVTEARNHSEEAPPLSVARCGSVQAGRISEPLVCCW